MGLIGSSQKKHPVDDLDDLSICTLPKYATIQTHPEGARIERKRERAREGAKERHTLRRDVLRRGLGGMAGCG